MTFELLPGLTPFVVVFFGLALLGIVVGGTTLATAVAGFVRTHRPQRLARHQSVPVYYTGLVAAR